MAEMFGTVDARFAEETVYRRAARIFRLAVPDPADSRREREGNQPELVVSPLSAAVLRLPSNVDDRSRCLLAARRLAYQDPVLNV